MAFTASKNEQHKVYENGPLSGGLRKRRLTLFVGTDASGGFGFYDVIEAVQSIPVCIAKPF